MSNNTGELRDLVAEVAAAYFSNTHVSVAEIPDVLAQITASLLAVEARRPPALTARASRQIAPSQPEIVDQDGSGKASASDIRRSVRPDGLISFEDGCSYRTLKRHLTNRGLTPEQYREKWGLPSDYPMVCADSSARRSDLAKQNGLGLKRKAPAKPAGRNGSARPIPALKRSSPRVNGAGRYA